MKKLLNIKFSKLINSSVIILLAAFMSFGLVSCSNDDVSFVNGDVVTDPDPDPNPSGLLTAQEMTSEMAAGFNLGNTFDNGIQTPTLANSASLIDLYAAAGMKNIRIPVTWMDGFSSNLADSDGNLDTSHPRFLELVNVIDYALDKGLYVIINAHHEHWLNDHYDGSASFDDKFANLWTGIATYFKDYSQKLVFETLNEPQGYFGEWNASPFPSPNSSTALSNTRNINEVAYNAIRATGGNNETRFIMVSVNALGNEDQIQEVYPTQSSLPGGGNDVYIGIQVHSYNPWAFCGQDGQNSNYPGNADIASNINEVAAHSQLLDVPVCYGEFGVGSASNQPRRDTDLVRGYYQTFHNTTINNQMSYNVWDDRGWFGLVNSSGTSFLYNIVPGMLQ